MTNAQPKFKFKDLCLLAIFRLSTDDKTQVLIKVGKTSAVKFTPSGEHGTDTLTYVYPTNEKKVRLAKDTQVYALHTRLLLGVDFHTVWDDEEVMSPKDLAEWNNLDPSSGPEPDPFKALPTKSTNGKISVKSKGTKLRDPGVTAKACDAADMELERYERGPIAATMVVHPHPQPGTQDAGMGNPATHKVKLDKKKVHAPQKAGKAVKGRK